MPEDATTTLTSRFEAVSKGAYLDVLLPKSSDFDASALIRDGSPEELARAPSRRDLFFGTLTLRGTIGSQLTEVQIYR